MTSRRIPVLWYLLPALALVLFLKTRVEPRAGSWLDKKPELDATQALVFARGVKRFSLGLDNWIAGLVWVRLLQTASHEPLTEGKLSWEYAQLRSIVELDRNFERAYDFGASFLSVFRRDREGAKDLLERWVTHRPHYWRTHYILGQHLYFEMEQYAPAAERILRAAALPGSPPWLSSLGVRLLSEEGAYRHSLGVAVRLFPSIADESGRQRLAERIQALRFHALRQHWQEKLVDFRARHGRAPAGFAELALAYPEVARAPSSVLEPDLMREIPEDPQLRALLAEPIPFRYDAGSNQIRHSDPNVEKNWGALGIRRPKS